MMGIGFRYLSKDKLQGFNYYKYSCIETNPITVYLFQPWWNRAVNVIPLWVAPNVLTLSGFILHLSILLVFSYHDYHFMATSNDSGIVKDPIPTWVWIYAGIAHFLAHTLDGIDGKQARRTGSSSPVGELFDHGLDSVVCFVIPVCLYSITGRGTVWGCTPLQGYWCSAAIMGGYYVSHWEKYITGTMYLPWAYDSGELGIMLMYTLTGILGVKFWQFHLIPGWTCSDIFRYGIIIGFFLSLVSSIKNVRESFNSSLDKYSTVSVTATIVSTNNNSSSSSSSHRQHRSFFALVIAPALPIMIWFSLFTIWILYSPTDISSVEPRLFILTMGIVFSNLSCRLIVSQMSGKNVEVFNYLFIPVVMAMLVSFLRPQYELGTLYGLLVTVLMAHVHFGCSIVYELCTYFNIYAFSLTKPSSQT